MRRNPTTEIETTRSEDITSLLGEAFEKGVEVGQGLSGGSFGERVEVEAVENPMLRKKRMFVSEADARKFLNAHLGDDAVKYLGMKGNKTVHIVEYNEHSSYARKRNSIFLTPAVMQQLGQSGIGRMLTKASNPEYASPSELAIELGPQWTICRNTPENRRKYGKCITHAEYNAAVKRALAKRKKRNPESTSAEVYAEFHGKPSEQLTEFVYEEHEHENLAQLGELISLTVVTTTGYEATIQAPPLDGPVTEVVQLCSTEDKRQLYLIGGDQCIDIESLGFKENAIKDLMVIGTLEQIEYCTEKSFHKFKPVDYYHQLGEETGVTPVLLYDPISKLMKIAGGEYEIKDVGIVN